MLSSGCSSSWFPVATSSLSLCIPTGAKLSSVYYMKTLGKKVEKHMELALSEVWSLNYDSFYFTPLQTLLTCCCVLVTIGWWVSDYHTVSAWESLLFLFYVFLGLQEIFVGFVLVFLRFLNFDIKVLCRYHISHILDIGSTLSLCSFCACDRELAVSWAMGTGICAYGGFLIPRTVPLVL
jgi:hypothetical protein